MHRLEVSRAKRARLPGTRVRCCVCERAATTASYGIRANSNPQLLKRLNATRAGRCRGWWCSKGGDTPFAMGVALKLTPLQFTRQPSWPGPVLAGDRADGS